MTRPAGVKGHDPRPDTDKMTQKGADQSWRVTCPPLAAPPTWQLYAAYLVVLFPQPAKGKPQLESACQWRRPDPALWR